MLNVLFFALGWLVGLLVRDWLREQRSLSVAAAKAEPDAFTAIKGIGPAFAEALNEIGLVTFADLARQDADQLAERLGSRVTGERIRRERWIEQARELARR